MDFSSPYLLLLLLVAPAVGSFLALVSDRLPKGQTIVWARSACSHCDAALTARDLVPVVSFAFLSGRCRHCRTQIPPWLLYMELAAIGTAIWAVILGQSVAEAWLIAVFLWVLVSLVATDLIAFRLPDMLTGALACVALTLALLNGTPSLSEALWGAAIGVASFVALRWGYQTLRGREGLGLGDVKLMVGLGAALGPYDLPLMLLLASLTSLAVAVVSGRISGVHPVPFGAALAAATGTLWIVRHLPA
jgi:leader peptidase (prepilin peptidase)/N-methyltransferase